MHPLSVRYQIFFKIFWQWPKMDNVNIGTNSCIITDYIANRDHYTLLKKLLMKYKNFNKDIETSNTWAFVVSKTIKCFCTSFALNSIITSFTKTLSTRFTFSIFWANRVAATFYKYKTKTSLLIVNVFTKSINHLKIMPCFWKYI